MPTSDLLVSGGILIVVFAGDRNDMHIIRMLFVLIICDIPDIVFIECN